MELPKTCIVKTGCRGYTLIEIIVVIALLVMTGALGVVMSMDSFRGYMFRNERDSIVAALQRARSLAVSNICEGAACDGVRRTGFILKKTIHDFPRNYFNGRGAGEIAFDQIAAIDAGGIETDARRPIDVVFPNYQEGLIPQRR